MLDKINNLSAISSEIANLSLNINKESDVVFVSTEDLLKTSDEMATEAQNTLSQVSYFHYEDIEKKDY